MVDYEGTNALFTDDDFKNAKDNLFEIFGELYNGETLKVILSETEGDIKDENKVILPSGFEEFNEKCFNKNEKTFSMIVNLFIYLIMELNEKIIDNNEIYFLRIAIIVITCLNGSISNNKNFIISPKKFDKDYIKANRGKIKEDDMEKIKKIISYFNIASNFIAFSTINYIRFNHHFPLEKTHLIKKVLLKLAPETIEELLEEEKRGTFYKQLVSACRINNELIFYENLINTELKTGHELKFKYYKLLGNISHEFTDEMIKIRKIATPNGFLILDLIEKMIVDIKAKSLLFLIPNIKIFGELMKIRNILRSNPFEFHPARYFFKVNTKRYDEIREKFLNYMSLIGGFVYYYTESMEETVIQAKCRNKYEHNVNMKDKKICEILFKLSEIKIEVKEDKLKKIKEKLNVADIELNEDTDIEAENNKASEILEGIVNSN